MHVEMRATLQILKAGTATGVSLWMAVLACLMGCTQPVLASSPAIVNASSSREDSAGHSQSGLMADMENCHHTSGDSSVPPNDRKPASNGPVSCCPLEITVTQKWDTTKLGIAPARDFVPSADFHFEAGRFSGPVELAESIWRSGRDTLLETHLLRI
jgi:hypothetical protein